MKFITAYCFIILIFKSISVYAQVDSLQQLDAVMLSDFKLKTNANGYKVTTLNDSVISKNRSVLTDVLRFNTTIYFKENGYGMVSSPAFRGTNASHTAIIWNGININSPLNGQVDFSTINTANYDNIIIRSGGGSVQYGSGAIGGSIHLENKLAFYKHFKNTLKLQYGSFNTKDVNYRLSTGNKKMSIISGINYTASDNDYKYLGTPLKNNNGAYNNLTTNLSFGYFISKNDVIKYYNQNYIGNRDLSGTVVTPSRSHYKDFHYRNMIEWGHFGTVFSSKLKIAYLHESFKYFENKNASLNTFGGVNTLITNYNFTTHLSKNSQLNVRLEYTYDKGKGSSFSNPSRNQISATTLFTQTIKDRFTYGVNLRKDFNSDYANPLIYAIDAKYIIAKPYTIKLNASKNFKIPTFNDLYWHPGGNLNLIPETSYQIDLGHKIYIKDILFQLNTYYINTKNMIIWQPGNTNFWMPVNKNNVINHGAEVEINYTEKIKNHHFNIQSQYAYTLAKDAETHKPQLYVPKHKATFAVAYSYKNAVISYQHLYTGSVRIIGSSLRGYNVANIRLGYQQKFKHIAYKIDFNIQNIYNTYYENVALRPMPNRNYQLQLTLNF